jgi:exo-beta-1,3-glucanase (GH17 family)
MCGATLANVTNDIKKLSQLTPRLRLYGSECNITSLVLNAIGDMKVDVDVFPAIYLEGSDVSYFTQKTALIQALANHGHKHVSGVVVGNEYILNAGSRGDTAANATRRLVQKMAEVRHDLVSLRYLNIPVGSSDSGGTVPQDLVDGADL